ncbi:tRNA lysidine(34) synthetase TilS [Methylobacter svalbardensis]|uniref:tRNA lysidine(34) synthetase TilS n=1 Tax=Methylobacter svalbardensis TaxID=3080016 RepID=UPI0030EB7A03
MKGERQKAKASPLFEGIISRLDLGNQRQKVYVAYSGGVDSHVLLHLCASTPRLKDKLRAVYVDHGLQAEAESWAEHCEKTANDLGVEFLTLRVNAQALPGESPEEAARNARYAALKSLMKVDDALLLAQHREDQLETVLLQLFRGSGLPGLSGMPERQAFGAGVMLRPLLNTPKQAISDYAQAYQLSWVEDPSNQSNDYDRNFLRNAVVPLLKQRWLAIDKTVARSAKHCADALVLVEEVAEELFVEVFNPADTTLCISRLTEHHLHQQQLIIRRWFRSIGLKMPAQAVVGRILSQVVAAAAQRDPVLSGQGYSIRRYRDKLYCLTNLSGTDLHLPEGRQAGKPDVTNLSGTDLHLPEGRQAGKPDVTNLSGAGLPQDAFWPVGQTSIKTAYNQILSCVPSSKGMLREQWAGAKVEIRFRRGGEKVCLPGRQGHHSLKNLFQEAGIPPWERDRIPLIYLDDRLAAVADKWISAEFYHEETNGCVSLLLQS